MIIMSTCAHKDNLSLSSEHTNTRTHSGPLMRFFCKVPNTWVTSKSACPISFQWNIWVSISAEKHVHVHRYVSVKWTQSILARSQQYSWKSSTRTTFLCTCLLVPTRLPPSLNHCNGSCSLQLSAWGYMQKSLPQFFFSLLWSLIFSTFEVVRPHFTRGTSLEADWQNGKEFNALFRAKTQQSSKCAERLNLNVWRLTALYLFIGLIISFKKFC